MEIVRPSKEDIVKLRNIPTSSLSDALDEEGVTGFMDFKIKPIVSGKKIVGPAITIKDIPSEEKKSPILALKAIDSAQKGDILVRAVEGNADNIGLWGGLMAIASKHKGIEGAVLDGGVRDTAEILELQFQIFAKSIIPTTSLGRTEVIAINVPITCGGIQVNPGDIIVGDADGVVVIPPKYLPKIIKRASEMDEIEKQEAEELRRGTSFIETIQKFSRI